MRCLSCGSSDYVVHRERYRYAESGLPQVTLENVPVYRCGECGEHEVVVPNIEALNRFLAQLLTQKPAPLMAEEFRFLRKQLGYSAQDFARRIGVAPETLSRWETGKRQVDPVADTLIRVLVATSQPVDRYPEAVLAPERRSKRAKAAHLALRAPTRRGGNWRAMGGAGSSVSG